jgi:hypothetical protein
MVGETRALRGARVVTLSSQVRRHPGRIDVYRPNPDGCWTRYDCEEASRFMRRLAGDHYGYRAVWFVALLHLPFVRLFVKPKLHLEQRRARRRPPFCSHACAMADRIGGGVDPVENLPDRLTEPADLARSPFYRYLFTIGAAEEAKP